MALQKKTTLLSRYLYILFFTHRTKRTSPTIISDDTDREEGEETQPSDTPDNGTAMDTEQSLWHRRYGHQIAYTLHYPWYTAQSPRHSWGQTHRSFTSSSWSNSKFLAPSLSYILVVDHSSFDLSMFCLAFDYLSVRSPEPCFCVWPDFAWRFRLYCLCFYNNRTESAPVFSCDSRTDTLKFNHINNWKFSLINSNKFVTCVLWNHTKSRV